MLLIANADITDIAENVSIREQFNNGASVFTFEYPVACGESFKNGSTVIFTYGGTSLFYGFLFKTRQDADRYQCTAYDQLRYLKAKNSLMRQIQTLDSFVNDVCAQIGDRIRLGTLDNTEIKLGKYLFDNKTHLDMIYQSIQDNLMLNGYYYCLRDNFGALELRDLYDLRLPLVIGEKSLAMGFDYERSIDDDTYNYIKVAKDDKGKGVRDTYIAQDSANISEWGKLMLYDKVSAELNAEQLKARANRLLALKNQETETLSVECVGDTRVHAGNGVKVEIEQAEVNLWAMVESVTHNFTSAEHIMKLELTFGRYF